MVKETRGIVPVATGSREFVAQEAKEVREVEVHGTGRAG